MQTLSGRTHSKNAMLSKMAVALRLQGKRVLVLRPQVTIETTGVDTTDDSLDTDPIHFWPIDLVPEDDDVATRAALDADRWARLDALAGWVE